MFKEIVIAFQSYFEAHRFIKKHKLWKWIVLPGLIYAILFAVSMIVFGESASRLIQWIFTVTHINNWKQHHQGGLLNFLFAFATFIFWLILVLLYFSLFKYIWLIIGSPIFAYLSEKTEAIIENRNFPFSFAKLGKDILRSIAVSFRNMLWQTLYVLSLLLLSFVPVAGWITPVIALIIEAYYYGFAMLYYSCERRNLSSQQSFHFIGSHRGLAIGNGFIFYTLHLVPVIGWIFAPAYAVVAATVSMIKVRENHPFIQTITA